MIGFTILHAASCFFYSRELMRTENTTARVRLTLGGIVLPVLMCYAYSFIGW